MIIKTLVENTSISYEYSNEHGLSLYIETKRHKLLFDLGASTLFIENAKKMAVNLSEVDLVVISHGHYDHGGGLKAFLDINFKAKIYLTLGTFGQHYSNLPNGEKKYIGLDQGIIPTERFIYTDGYQIIDDELELFTNVKGSRLEPSGNKDLLMKIGNCFQSDGFAHEQNLIIKQDGKELLLAGCAHKGIVNIVEHFAALKKKFPSNVIGGFHLHNRSTGRYEDPALVGQIGTYLMETNANYYTCHCTGIESFMVLKKIMGDRIHYLPTGSQLIL